MDINWYPGHMAKAKRLLADQLSRVDVVVELCDARLPYSSRNPDLDKLLAGKKRVLLLNKADLADPAATSAWLNYFRAQGIDAAPYSASTGKAKDALAVIDRAAKEAVERAAQKGIRKTVKAMVVGVGQKHLHQQAARRQYRQNRRPPRRHPRESVGAHYALP